MIRKTLCSVLIGTLICIQSFAGEPVAVYGDAWMEQIGEYPVIHLKGTEYEMGVQLGYLAGDRLQAQADNLRAIANKQYKDLAKLPNWLFYGIRRTIGAIYYVFYPKNIKEQMKGIIDGAKKRSPAIKLNKMDIAFMNSLIDLTGFVGAMADKFGIEPKASDVMKWLGLPVIHSNCDSMAVWGPRTQDGKTFQNRNTDIDTGNGVERYPLIMIEKKDGAVPIASASITGMLGIFAGMNAHGVGLGQVWATSNEARIWTPWQHQIRETFLKARNSLEAATLFSQMGKAAYGSNFVFADAGDGGDGSNSEGYTVEVTSKQLAIFRSNDPKELEVKVNGETFGLPLPYAVLRGDVSMDVGIRSQQTAANGPSGDPRTTGSYNDRYKGLYDRILKYEQAGVKMGVDETIAISRETAMKKSNLLNAVYANTDRNMWVAYSKIEDDGSTTQAYQRDYVNVPFYQYLSTLRYEGEGRVSVQSYLTEKKRDLTIHILRGTELIDSPVSLIADQEWVSLNLKRMPVQGDVLELRETATGALVDRMVIRQ